MKEKFLLFVISVSLLLSGCGGQSVTTTQGEVDASVIAPISIYATLQGMRAAAAGNAGTFLMESDKVIVFAWSKGSAWNFAAIARDGRPVLDMVKEFVNGQKIDTYSFSGFIKSLESAGFKQITPDLLPAEVTGTLLGYTTELLSLGVRALPSVMVIPVVPSMLEVPGRVEVQG